VGSDREFAAVCAYLGGFQIQTRRHLNSVLLAHPTFNSPFTKRPPFTLPELPFSLDSHREHWSTLLERLRVPPQITAPVSHRVLIAGASSGRLTLQTSKISQNRRGFPCGEFYYLKIGIQSRFTICRSNSFALEDCL
jgi:hypothetical protein